MRSIFAVAFLSSLFLLGCVTQDIEVKAAKVLSNIGPLGIINGEWRGEASGYNRDGTPYTILQTERVGPMLDGDATVIEGRGYASDGSLAFNAFAVVGLNVATGQMEMRSHAMGRVETFPISITGDGYSWSTPAGPNAQMTYDATISDGVLTEIGTYVRRLANHAKYSKWFFSALEAQTGHQQGLWDRNKQDGQFTNTTIITILNEC